MEKASCARPSQADVARHRKTMERLSERLADMNIDQLLRLTGTVVLLERMLWGLPVTAELYAEFLGRPKAAIQADLNMLSRV